MSKQREALKIALEVLDSKHNFNSAEWRVLHYRAFQVIREALAEPEKANQCGETCERAKLCAVCANGLAEPKQKPVYQISLTNGPAKAAWIDVDEVTYYSAKMDATYMARCLYAAPPARKPLTDEQIDAAWRSVDYTQPYEGFRIAIARAIERAHGITE